MTRDEEVRNAIDTIIPIFPSNNGRTYEQALMASGFEAGVKWADANPKSHQISIKDDSPCNHKELEDLKKQYIYEKSLLERYGYPSIITFEEWIKIKNIKL